MADTAEPGPNEDLKAKMREALDRKKAHDRGVPGEARLREKVHGAEVVGGAPPRSYRPKAGES
jgi:hypothetical protein